MMHKTCAMAGCSMTVLLLLLCVVAGMAVAQQSAESQQTPAASPGVVRRIGIRASVVHTLQGADIIVPNSQLVTEQVTNWTLTDQLRRIDLPVGVNYGAVPQQVIALLETVARAHPQVLPEPPPRAFFMGYGDRAINFTLFAWPDHFNHWLPVKSDLTTAVYEAVSAAGMSFPFPQCEVRVLHEAAVPQARETLPHAAGG